jgi:hypothetical protein
MPGMLPPFVQNLLQRGAPFPAGPHAPFPYGWIRPEGPSVTGNERLYLRCTTWPGPRGLTPADAANNGLPPAPGAPVPGVPARPSFHHSRHHRRR